VPIVQISRIQHRRGRSTDLPQLASGELGWVIDEQRLYIGNGTVADGAPAVGNTEILTSGSASFSAALNYVYKGYLGDATLISTGGATDITRTLQERLDDYVSVKAFGAVGDGSTNDTVAIQRAIDELYCDPDRTDARSRRLLFFPAGQYNIVGPIYIPPYAQLSGEGIDKTVIYQSGGNSAVAKMQDSLKQNGANIGNSSATLPTNINIENITFKNGEWYAGFEIEKATNVRFTNCKFQGTYVAGGSDVSTSKAVTVISTTPYTCSNILFDSCQFTKFARLVDFSYDLTSAKFINCDFSTAYYGVIVGEQLDGSTTGLTIGPKDIKILSSQFANIYANGIRVDAASSGADSGSGEVRNVVSFNNFFARTVGTANDNIDLLDDQSPVILFNTDECVSMLDYFDGSQRRSSANTPIPEVQGIGTNKKSIRQITLTAGASDQSTGIKLHVSAGKKVVVDYKIVNGTAYRVGTFTVNANGTSISYNDDYEENSDPGITLTSSMSDDDSTVAGNDTVTIKYSSSSGTNATMDHEVTEMV
jgi:polygalacturonase